MRVLQLLDRSDLDHPDASRREPRGDRAGLVHVLGLDEEESTQLLLCLGKGAGGGGDLAGADADGPGRPDPLQSVRSDVVAAPSNLLGVLDCGVDKGLHLLLGYHVQHVLVVVDHENELHRILLRGEIPPGWFPSDSGPRSAGSQTACRCAPGSWLLSRLDAASASFLDIGHVVLDKIYQADVLHNPPAAGEWLRTPACRSEGVESADSARDVSRSITGLRGEACALERSDAPIRIRAQLGREGVQGLQRAVDRGAAGGGLRSQEANPRQRDIEGAKPPASSAIDELTRLREERAGSRAVAGGQLRVRKRREDARLVPQRGAATTSERERPLEHTRGRGEVAVRELRSAE